LCSSLVALFISLTASHVLVSGGRLHSLSGQSQEVHAAESQKPLETLNALLQTLHTPAGFKHSAAPVQRSPGTLKPGAGSRLGSPKVARSRSVVSNGLSHYHQRTPAVNMGDKLMRSDHETPKEDGVKKEASKQFAALAASIALLTLADPAYADEGAGNLVSDLVVRGHQWAILITIVSLISQNSFVYPKMNEGDFNAAKTASITYVGGAILSLLTGILLVGFYGKGWFFYSHEPTFWLKMELFSVLNAFAFFPTIRIAKQATRIKNAAEGVKVPKMSRELIGKMSSTYNRMFIPFVFTLPVAALIANGIPYIETFPWQAGAAPVVLTVGGLGFKNVKDALDWNDEAIKQKEDEEFAAMIEAKAQAAMAEDQKKPKKKKKKSSA